MGNPMRHLEAAKPRSGLKGPDHGRGICNIPIASQRIPMWQICPPTPKVKPQKKYQKLQRHNWEP